MKALIVTGDRNATDEPWANVVHDAIAKAHTSTYTPFILMHGDANGIDHMAQTTGEHRFGVSVIPIPAQWDQHGKAAGPRRNEAMLSMLLTLRDHGYKVAVFAFHDALASSKGTGHMVRIAVKAGVNTVHYRSDGTWERVTP